MWTSEGLLVAGSIARVNSDSGFRQEAKNELKICLQQKI